MEEIIEKIKAIDVNENTILAINVKVILKPDRAAELKRFLEKETGCKCIILGNDIEIVKVFEGGNKDVKEI